MSPVLRAVNISRQIVQGMGIVAEELVAMAQQLGIALDVIVIARARGSDARPSVMAMVGDKPAITALLEGAYEFVLSEPDVEGHEYEIGG